LRIAAHRFLSPSLSHSRSPLQFYSPSSHERDVLALIRDQPVATLGVRGREEREGAEVSPRKPTAVRLRSHDLMHRCTKYAISLSLSLSLSRNVCYLHHPPPPAGLPPLFGLLAASGMDVGACIDADISRLARQRDPAATTLACRPRRSYIN